jgi:hypothetical protein
MTLDQMHPKTANRTPGYGLAQSGLRYGLVVSRFQIGRRMCALFLLKKNAMK